MEKSIDSSYTDSFITPEVKVNKNVVFGPFQKSRIPVLIKKPLDNKPVNIKQLMRVGSAKSNFSSTRSSTELLKREEFRLNKSLRNSNFVGNSSSKRNRDVCRQHKKLDCIRDRENKVSYFPSYGSNLVDWDSRLKNADSKTNPRLEDDVLFDQTAKLLEKISGFFSQKSKNESPECHSRTAVRSNDDSRHQACVDPYVADILKSSLEKEVYYTSLFKKKFTVEQEEQRRSIIQRVAQLNLHLKVHHDIFHLAVFISDAFLQVQKCTSECCSLLAVTAFFIASKLESQCHHSIEELVRLSKNFRYHEKEVRWMEKYVLHKLSFDICPPTSQHFLELCTSQLDFPNEHLKSLAIDLSSAILMRSISDIPLISLKASLKAQTAASVATEYIMFHKNTIMKRFGVLHFKNIACSLFFDSAVTKCYNLFRTLLCGSENDTNDGRNATSTLARNRSVRGMIKLASSSHCILVK